MLVVSVQVLTLEVVYGTVDVSVQTEVDEVMIVHGMVLQVTVVVAMVYGIVFVSMTSVSVEPVTGTIHNISLIIVSLE